jgi:hypothetical protein
MLTEKELFCPAHRIPAGCGMEPDIELLIESIGHERRSCPDCLRMATERRESC